MTSRGNERRMPRTRRGAAAAFQLLESLPDEVFNIAVQHLGAEDELACLQLRVASARLHQRAREVLANLGASKNCGPLFRLTQVHVVKRLEYLQWRNATGALLFERDAALRLCATGMRDEGWATSTVLPRIGLTSWTFSFGATPPNVHMRPEPGISRVGLCDDDGAHACSHILNILVNQKTCCW